MELKLIKLTEGFDVEAGGKRNIVVGSVHGFQATVTVEGLAGCTSEALCCGCCQVLGTHDVIP